MSTLFTYTTPAERDAGCFFSDNFYNSTLVSENNGTPIGDVRIKNGATFVDGTYDRIQYLANGLFDNKTSLAIVIVFYPKFMPSDTSINYWFDTTNGYRYYLLKNGSGGLQWAMGNTALTGAVIGDYQTYWRLEQRNVFVLNCTSGSNQLWLNGNQILTNTIAWTPKKPVNMWIGSTYWGSQSFIGVIKKFKIFNRKLSNTEILDYSNNTISDYYNQTLVSLPLTTKYYDIANVRTLDISGNNYHATLGDGSTSSTFPTQGTIDAGMKFDYASGQYLNLGDNSNFTFGNGSTDSPFTFSFFTKIDTTGVSRGIHKREVGAQEYQLTIAGTNIIYFNIFDNSTGGYIGKQKSISALKKQGQWIHVCGTYDGSGTEAGMKIFLNGVDTSASPSSAGSYTAMEDTSAQLHIGKYLTEYASGKIAFVKIFSKKLTPLQVLDLYNKDSKYLGYS